MTFYANGKCPLCGVDRELGAEWAKNHLVEAHGFKRDEWGVVYKPRTCLICGSTAFYKVNGSGYCRKHKDSAVNRRISQAQVLDKGLKQIEADRKERDYVELGRKTLHDAKSRKSK